MTVEELLAEAARYEDLAAGKEMVIRTAYLAMANNLRLRALCLLAQGFNGE